MGAWRKVTILDTPDVRHQVWIEDIHLTAPVGTTIEVDREEFLVTGLPRIEILDHNTDDLQCVVHLPVRNV